jgi:hypothetical protein
MKKEGNEGKKKVTRKCERITRKGEGKKKKRKK